MGRKELGISLSCVRSPWPILGQKNTFCKPNINERARNSSQNPLCELTCSEWSRGSHHMELMNFLSKCWKSSLSSFSKDDLMKK